jgi:methyl-accepting chemotaxis protein
MTSIKIKYLLPALFGLLALIGLAQGGLGLFSLDRMHNQAIEIADHRIPSIGLIHEINTAASSVRRAHADHIFATGAEQTEEAQATITRRSERMAQLRANYENYITLDATQQLYDEFAAEWTNYEAAANSLIIMSRAGQKVAAQDVYSTSLRQAFFNAEATLEQLLAVNQQEVEASLAASETTYVMNRNFTFASIAVSFLLAIAAIMIGIRRIATPITRITASMNNLAAGDLQSVIPFAERKDEIGEMAEAVVVFRNAGREKVRLEGEAEAGRSQSEKDRQAREEQERREAAELKFAVDALGAGLGRLADGDVAYRIEDNFVSHLDKLRVDFNHSVGKLETALRSVGENAIAIGNGSEEIRVAADDLSRRTEQQAASVEETAAALEEITTTVRDAAKRAEEAGQLVSRTRAGAEKSGMIVKEAVSAMTRIEESSSQITNIIGVIDDIAFQTNLLALNAGVEAARAGDAGKGFAVVAQEVRELAQRSANAAKEIKALINSSGEQVKAGVRLVGDTGKALDEIVGEVQEINRHVMSIVESAREQAIGLNEINTAVTTIDQGTQQNAAMVEQTTAASHGLAREASNLNGLLEQFRLGGGVPARSVAAPALVTAETRPAAPARSPAKELGRKLAGAFNLQRSGGAQAAVAENWEEF